MRNTEMNFAGERCCCFGHDAVGKRRRRATGRSFHQRAVTTAETLVAMAVLGTAVAGVGRFVGTMQQGLQDRQLSVRMGWEILNARERIGSWRHEDISIERIEAMEISESLAGRLEDARWEAQLRSIEEPVAARQVTLRLLCTYRGQPARPQQLTFWVPLSAAGSAEPPGQQTLGEPDE